MDEPKAGVMEPKSRLLSLNAAEIPPLPVRWLWPERIALGKLTVIAGDPGLGKSQVTLDIAARVTRGARWPVDGTLAPKGDVLIISAEDDPADTIIPRLIAAQAVMGRVRVSESVLDYDPKNGVYERSMALERDLDLIEAEINSLANCKLLIVDPLTAFAAGTDTHKTSDVRALLAPLGRLAQRCGIAVLGVSHLNKSGQQAIQRVTGSMAWVAAARAAYVVGKDPSDPKRRILTPIKNNLGDDETGFAYRIESSASGAPFVAWEDDAVLMSADEVLSGDDEQHTAREEAKDFLEDLLGSGPVESKEVLKSARQAGFSESTVRRAKSELKISAQKKHFQGGWYWTLPGQKDTKVVTPPGDENLTILREVDHLRERDRLQTKLTEVIQGLNISVDTARSLFSQDDLDGLESGKLPIDAARHFLEVSIEDGQK